MSVFTSQYARALADVVMTDRLDTQQVDQQLTDFLAAFTESKELREVFSNPSIALSSKLKVLDAIAPRVGMVKQVRNFLALLLQNYRIPAFPFILTEYRNEIDARLHISQAEITSVRELDVEERGRIEAKAAALAGLKIRANYKQDPSLLGGVVLRIGDTIYDGSVRGRLEELREKLIAN